MKTIKIFVTLLLLSTLTIVAFADASNPTLYQYTNPEVTVSFSEPLDISAQHQQEIADSLAGIASPQLYDPQVISPDNIICSLFGHKLSTTTVTATHHKVDIYSPRCLMEIYDVSACSRCNYTDATLISSFYIFCCPED